MNDTTETNISNSMTQMYAGFWIRFVAYLIDTVVMVIPIGFYLFVSGNPFTSLAQLNAFIYIGSILGILLFIYSPALESSKWQATLGKMALGLKVVDEDGNRISVGQAVGRYLGKFVSTIIIGIGFLMIGFTKKKQGLHDKMAGSLVIYK